ncbi:MAG: patatin-like phospholipase family protein [Solirubrobacteraceae bacterium]
MLLGPPPLRPDLSTRELLAGVPVLAGIDERLLDELAAEVESVDVRPGQWVFREGDEADCAYIIASGRVEVISECPVPTVLRELRRGAAFGELALLRQGTRAASVRARGDCTLLLLSRDQFELLLHDSPAFALALVRALGEQVATSHGGASVCPAQTLALVSLDDGLSARPFGEELVAGLRRIGCTAALATGGDADPASWPARLGELERTHERVVLLAGAGNHNAWNTFCVRDADRIVAITAGHPCASWLAHPESLRDCELLTLSPDGGDALVDRVRPRSIRAIRDGVNPRVQIDPLARRIAGRAIGVVLSGGGARALAHLGAIEVLRSEGVRIDRIGGVSLGAIVAALVALGRTDDQIRSLFERHFLEQNPSNDYTLPIVSLIKGRKTAQMLHAEFGDIRIEELPTPFFCLSTDLVHRQPVVHRTGALSTAVLASLSIPGVYPPVLAPYGRLLADGGILDNLPVSVMANESEGPVIAIDVTGDGAHSSRRPPSGRPRLTPAATKLRRLLTGSAAPLPRLPETIIRCMTLAASDTVAAGRRHADIVIAPEVAGVGVLDWKRLPEMREAGAQAARRALSEQHDAFSAFA